METEELIARLLARSNHPESDYAEAAARLRLLTEEVEKLKGERDEARRLVRWAHDTLYEINPSNYDHDEVCKLNDASVEVILGLAPSLGETHGKTREWWLARARAEGDLAVGAVGGAAEAEVSTLRQKLEVAREALGAVDGELVELGLAAQRKANGQKYEKFSTFRQNARRLIRAAITTLESPDA